MSYCLLSVVGWLGFVVSFRRGLNRVGVMGDFVVQRTTIDLDSLLVRPSLDSEQPSGNMINK